MKPEDRAKAKPVPVPTHYPPGTVWRCACSRTWVLRPGQHYGRNPHIGYTDGRWTPVRWYHRKLRRQAAIRDTQDAYEAAAQIVDSWQAPD